MSGAQIAAVIADFYRGLIEGGVPAEVAERLTVALGERFVAGLSLTGGAGRS